MRNPPLIAAYVVLNEIDYLEASLRTIYSTVDRIIIVENTNKCARAWANSQGLSTDGTTELIRDFPDPQGKIIYVPLGFVEGEWEARQAYLDRIETESILVVLDGDEVFYPGEIERAYEMMYELPVEILVGRHFMFWGDLRHYVRDETAQRRFLRVTSGLQTGASWSAELNWSQEPQICIPDDPPRLLHFGYVRQPRRLLQKVHYAYNYIRDLAPGPETYHIHSLEESEIPGEILLNHPCFTRQVPTEWEIVEFNEPLPEPFETHPFASLTEAEILDAAVVAQLWEEVENAW